jgi:hypothetical protein
MNESGEQEESGEQDQVLESAAVLMEGLAIAFRGMMRKPARQRPSVPAKGPRVGQRVRIVRKDAYHQMTGDSRRVLAQGDLLVIRVSSELIPGCGCREGLYGKSEFGEEALAYVAVVKEFGDCISKVHGYGRRSKK